MRVKIKDIAERAGVSLATVSLVLNDRPGVSQKTREKVMHITRDLHYQRLYLQDPGRVKRGTIRFLKIAKHGLTVNRDHDVFIADYIDGLDRESRRLGYNLEISTFHTTDISNIIDSIQHADVDGVVVLGTELNYDDIRQLEQLDKPMVIIDTYYDYLNCNFVDMNNIDSVFQIITNFVENGHTRIGFIKTPSDVNNFRQRELGFGQTLRYFGLEYDDRYIYSVGSTFDGAYRDMLSILKKDSPLPTALFSSNDIIAYGCIKALKEYGVAVPEDLSIIGFDDLPMSAVMDPPLTTMWVSKGRIGGSSVQLLHSLLEQGSGLPPTKITICGKLVCRRSVKKLNGQVTG